MDHQVPSNDPPAPGAPGKYDHLPGSTPREKIRNAYAQLRASANAGSPHNISASVTPSSAGDIEPTPPVSIPETIQPLSIRVDKEPITHPTMVEDHSPSAGAPVTPTVLYADQSGVQTIQPSALTFDQTENNPPGSLQLGPSEFAITLPMDSRVRDDYERALADHSRVVQQFLSGVQSTEGTSTPEAQMISTIDGLIEKLDNITVHPDLNMVQHIKHSSPDLQKEAAWAEYSSSKFQLLGHLVEIARTHDLHVVVMAKNGNAAKLVERYFSGKGFVYARPRAEMRGNIEVSMTHGPLSVGLQTTQPDGVMETLRPPSAIIALDSSFNAANPSVEHLRTTYARHGNLLPVIRLIVSNSSEHIKRCLPDVSDLEKLRLLVRLTTHLRNAVGDLQDDALGVQEDAEELLTYFLSDNSNLSWTLPTIKPLHIFGTDEMIPTIGTDPVGLPSEDVSVDMASFQKRLLDDTEGDTYSAKRLRLGPSQEPSQLTQSSKAPSQRLDIDLKALENNLLQMKNTHANELHQLQTTVSNVQTRLSEREKTLETLQHRYETRTKELHQVRKERDSMTEKISKLEQRLQKHQGDISKLKDERTQLKHDLEAARNDIKAEGGLKEELEAAREEIRILTKDNANLEKKTEYERKQAEYTREQYQNASTVAAQSANEIRQLKNENQELKRKLSAEAAKLKEIKLKNDEDRHLQRVGQLEVLLATRSQMLSRKEDELREIRKNRPATRATSAQPRSPKWGPNSSRPTSPGVNNGIGGRGSGLRFSSEMPPL